MTKVVIIYAHDVAARFRTRFLEKRREGLAYFLKFVSLSHGRHRVYAYNGYSCVLLNPEFAGTPVMRDFIFS